MNPNTTVRCLICGKDIYNGQPCVGSKARGQKPVYAHKDCIKKRKERKR